MGAPFLTTELEWRLYEAIEPFANIKADNGDNFDSCDDQVIIRCEVAVAELRRAREARALAVSEREPGDEGKKLAERLEETAGGLDNVSAALSEVHLLGRDGDDTSFDAHMFGQIATVERAASLLRRCASLALARGKTP